MTDYGPALPAPRLLYQHMREIEQIARRAAEYAMPGPRQDIGAVLRAKKAISDMVGHD